MADRGVRVFELTATSGVISGAALPVEDPVGNGVSLRERIVAAAERLAVPTPAGGPGSRRTLTSVPAMGSMAKWEPPIVASDRDPQIWILATKTVANGHLLVTFKHGVYGEYDEAMGEEGAIDLRKKAPSRTYRALIMLPLFGTRGRLVVDAIGPRCPSTMLVHWLTKSDCESYPESWLRLNATLTADRDKLKRLIADSGKLEIELRETRPSMPGRRKGRAKTLKIEVDSELSHESVVSALYDVLNGGRDDEFVERLERIAGLNPEELDSARLQFDGASVVVTDPTTNQPRVVNPERVRDWFTYPNHATLGEDDSTWVDEVRKIVQGTLSEGTDIQV